MYQITVLGTEFFNEETETFETHDDIELRFEHSLASLSKWESIWAKPFLSKDEKPVEEIYSYIECMCLNENIAPEVFYKLTSEQINDLMGYVNSKRSATWFNEINPRANSRQIITSELIYSWMVGYQIPFRPAEEWHLDRLITLIKVCSAQQEKPKKMTGSSAAAQRRELNARRKAEMGTSG